MGVRARRGAAQEFLKQAVVWNDGCLIWPYHRFQKTGYACIRYGGRLVTASRVVCEMVHGVPPPGGVFHAAHSCGNGAIGCVSGAHLRWATALENAQDKKVHNTENQGERHPNSRLTAGDIVEIRKLKGEKKTSEIASMFGISDRYVGKIQRGECWMHI